MATGTIVAINHNTGMFIVQVDGGDFAVFELLDGIELELQDRVRGDLDALGSETLQHLGHGEAFEAFGQSGSCNLQAARSLIA